MADYSIETDPGVNADEVRETVDHFGGRSEDELFDALKQVTEAERSAGRLDDTRMENIYEKLAPLLTERQREKMREVIRRLKE